MKIKVKIEKRQAYLIIGLIVIIAGALIVNAQAQGKPNPGHSLSEINGNLDGDGDGIIDESDRSVTAGTATLATDLNPSKTFEDNNCNTHSLGVSVINCENSDKLARSVRFSEAFLSPDLFNRALCCEIQPEN
jgi:hypothetical protein